MQETGFHSGDFRDLTEIIANIWKVMISSRFVLLVMLNIPLLLFPHNKTSNRTQNLHNHPPVWALVSQQIPEKSDDISRVQQSDSRAVTSLSLTLKYLFTQHASPSFLPNESVETEKQTSV